MGDATAAGQPPWAREAAAVLEEQGVEVGAGLSAAVAAERLARHGPNVLRSVQRVSAWVILLNQGKSLIVALLVVAGLLSLVMGDYVEAAAVGAVLLVNTAIGFVTELRAVRSMEALRELGKVEARVRRDGRERGIPAQELVPGDVVVLEGGDVITADLRVVEASKLAADESVLTGEALPISKQVEPCPAGALLADRRNMLFKGTALTRGSGLGLVVATGMQTELGRIAELVAQSEDEPTPLERRLENLGRRLVVVAIGVAAVASAVGVASGESVAVMVELGIALAVASIPEGLPVVATMALARGMWRLARRNALIRELSAVETLGATSVILTDKTGTLTENRMTVTGYVLADGEPVHVSGEGLALTGTFSRGGAVLDPLPAPLRLALELGALCNDASLEVEGARVQGLGDPLEVALLLAGRKAGLRRSELLAAQPELREEAFDPVVKMMATAHEAGDGAVRFAVKGASEAVLGVCDRELTEAGPRPLDDARRGWWREREAELAGRGLRVLALATRDGPAADAPPYQALMLVGLVALQDPPRAGVRQAVEACRSAGVRLVMATGDQAPTGVTIARAVGLLEDDEAGRVYTGADLGGGLPAEALARGAVFARVDPEQKLRLVEGYQARGEVVAMTGDGVNDAPALRRADIGVAMGQRGTQVAREAAEMVLRDDSLDSIVVAIRQGRVIFDNIRKFVVYLLSCNLAEIGVIGVATVLGLPLPLLPLQILFLNLLTDVFPALALGFGEGDPGVMQRPPRPGHESLLRREDWVAIVGYAALITVVVVAALALALGPLGYDRADAVTLSFLTLGFTQLWHVFNMRTPGSSFLRNDVLRNPHVWGALGLCAGLLVAAVEVAPLAQVLHCTPPTAEGWAWLLGLSAVPWALGQLYHARAGAPTPRAAGP